MEQVLETKIREVHENAPSVVEKFGTKYRTLVLEDLEGGLEYIEYKVTRAEKDLVPGDLVICKLCTFDGQIKFWRACPIKEDEVNDPNDRVNQIFNAPINERNKMRAQRISAAAAKTVPDYLFEAAANTAAQYIKLYKRIRDDAFQEFKESIDAYNALQEHEHDHELGFDSEPQPLAPIHPLQVEKIVSMIYTQALRRYNL